MTLLGWELLVASGAWLLASLIVFRTVRWARQRQLLDVPIYRSAHTHPKPRLGGIGIVVAVSLGCLAAWPIGTADLTVLIFAGGIALVVAAVSLIDDLSGLPALPRLAVHSFAAVATVVLFGWITTVQLPGGLALGLGALGLIVSLVWIIGFINTFNFMDGIDGIAGSQAALAGLAWAAIGWITDQPVLAWAGLLLSGASLGFLRSNWQPSSIFLGDVGATYLGYWVAAMPFLGDEPGALALPAVLIAWPFVFDVILTLGDRIRRREHLLAGHQRHLYQRLAAAGVSHAQVSAIYTALSAVGAVAAITMVAVDGLASVTGLIAVVASAAALYQLVVRRERTAPVQRAPSEALTDIQQAEP